MLARIAAAACSEPDGTVLEIGPGEGALTAHLLPRAARVVAVEIDPPLVEHLRVRFAGEPRLTIVPGDVLATDLAQWGPVFVAGNLPYYVTSPIIERVLAMADRCRQATFLVQKEVAERIASPPGKRDYGYLSVLAQAQATVKLLFTVPPGAFQPPPKVDSAVVQLVPRPVPLTGDLPGFQAFAGRAFALKRKTLRNNLRQFYLGEKLAALPEAGRRAEELGVAELVDIWQRLERRV